MTKRHKKLNGDELLETFRKLSSQPGAISDHATDAMILAGIVDVRDAIKGVSDDVGELAGEMHTLKTNEIAHLTADVKELKKNWDDNPSIIYLLRYKTTATVRALLVISVIVVFVLLSVWFNSDFQHAILDFLNMPHVDPTAIP